MVVSGAQPGPGMWKVTKGDHVLWILGTLSPLPKKMEWQSRDVEAVIAQAQEVLSWRRRVALNVKIGFFQGLMLAPKLIGIRKNPGGASLQQNGAGGHVRALVAAEAQVHRSTTAASRQWRPTLRRHQAVRRGDRRVPA